MAYDQYATPPKGHSARFYLEFEELQCECGCRLDIGLWFRRMCINHARIRHHASVESQRALDSNEEIARRLGMDLESHIQKLENRIKELSQDRSPLDLGPIEGNDFRRTKEMKKEYGMDVSKHIADGMSKEYAMSLAAEKREWQSTTYTSGNGRTWDLPSSR